MRREYALLASLCLTSVPVSTVACKHRATHTHGQQSPNGSTGMTFWLQTNGSYAALASTFTPLAIWDSVSSARASSSSVCCSSRAISFCPRSCA